jgi:hypothetical protein
MSTKRTFETANQHISCRVATLRCLRRVRGEDNLDSAPLTALSGSKSFMIGRYLPLRFDIPDFGGRKLQKISWDQWSETFDRRKLVFLFQQRLKNGNQSNFFRLNSPVRENA